MKRLFRYSTFQMLVAAGFAALLGRALFPTVSQAMSSILNGIPWSL